MYLVPFSSFTGFIVVIYILLLLLDGLVSELSLVTAIFVVRFSFFIVVDTVGDIDDDAISDDFDGGMADVEFEDDVQSKDCDTEEEASDVDEYDFESEGDFDIDDDCDDCSAHGDVEVDVDEENMNSVSDVDVEESGNSDSFALVVETDAVDDNGGAGFPEDSVDCDITFDVDGAADDDDCMLFVSSVKEFVASVVDEFDEYIEVDCKVEEEDRDIWDSDGFFVDPQVESSMLLLLFVDTRRKRE